MLIGAVAGLVVHFIMRGIVGIFDLDRKALPEDIPPTGHDAVSYRAAREEKRRKEQERKERRAARAQLLASQPWVQEVVRTARYTPISTPLSPSPSHAARQEGLAKDTILEHTDEEDDSAF